MSLFVPLLLCLVIVNAHTHSLCQYLSLETTRCEEIVSGARDIWLREETLSVQTYLSVQAYLLSDIALSLRILANRSSVTCEK